MTPILSTDSTLNQHAPPVARRVAVIASGVLLGVALSVAGMQARHPSAIVSEVQASQVSVPAGKKAAKAGKSVAARLAGWHEIGLASWYGKEFQGKATADGETFDMNDLTCAHRFLPLGTWVKVTNLHTHKWIVVRVNDRGPVPETRIADLSSQAARMLDMRGRGVTRIRLDVIDPQQAVEVARLEQLRLARQAAEAEQPLPGD